MDSHGLLEIVHLGANIAVVPLVAVLFSMQGRLSKIEGMLAHFFKQRED